MRQALSENLLVLLAVHLRNIGKEGKRLVQLFLFAVLALKQEDNIRDDLLDVGVDQPNVLFLLLKHMYNLNIIRDKANKRSIALQRGELSIRVGLDRIIFVEDFELFLQLLFDVRVDVFHASSIIKIGQQLFSSLYWDLLLLLHLRYCLFAIFFLLLHLFFL